MGWIKHIHPALFSKKPASPVLAYMHFIPVVGRGGPGDRFDGSAMMTMTMMGIITAGKALVVERVEPRDP